MEHEFWFQRWEEGQIGFHQDRINEYLTRHWDRLQAAPGARVLVPLCGKSLDMIWLKEQGHDVLGVELSPLAVEAFFKENGLAVERSSNDSFSICESEKITILCGDFFDLTADLSRGIDVVYDRASLVALPKEMRERYAAHLIELLPSGGRVLLVTFDYPQDEMNGPPFSVTADEVNALYAVHFEIEALEAVDMIEGSPLQARGLSRLTEQTFLLRKK